MAASGNQCGIWELEYNLERVNDGRLRQSWEVKSTRTGAVMYTFEGTQKQDVVLLENGPDRGVWTRLAWVPEAGTQSVQLREREGQPGDQDVDPVTGYELRCVPRRSEKRLLL